MVGWHHRLNGHGFGWTPGVGDGQGALACCGSWGEAFLDLCGLTQSCFPNNTPAESFTESVTWATLAFFIFHLYSFFLTFYFTLEYSSPWWKKGRQPTPISLSGESHG